MYMHVHVLVLYIKKAYILFFIRIYVYNRERTRARARAYVCVCMYTYIRIGKQNIYRLHDQYGGQTHRHPPGEGQLDLRNFVLPSILLGSFFGERDAAGGWRHEGSTRLRRVELYTTRMY